MQKRVIPLLDEFISALNTTERQQLKPLKYKGRKRSLLLSLLKHQSINHQIIQQKRPSERDNKLRSELLEYAYRTIVPSGGYALLYFLIERGLYRHFVKELIHQERIILATSNAEQIEAFYREINRMLNMVPILRTSEKVIWEKLRVYPKRYIDSKIIHQKDDEYYFPIFETAFLMRDALRSSNKLTKVDEIEKILLAFESQLKQTENLLVKVLLLRRIIIFYRNIKPDYAKLESYYLQEIEFFDAHPEVKQFVISGILELHLGELAYFKAQREEAFDIFYTQYRKNGNSVHGWTIYYTQLFILISQSKGEYELSQRLLDERFRYFIDFYNSPHTVLACVFFTRQYLLTADIERAKNYLLTGVQKNIGPLYDKIHELDFKMSEVALALFEKKMFQAQTLAEAALVLCRRRGYSLKTHRIPHYFKICIQIADAYSLGEYPDESIISNLSRFEFPFDYPKNVLIKILHTLYPDKKNL